MTAPQSIPTGGTYQPRKGRREPWAYRIDLPPKKGKRQQRTRSGFPDKRTAQAALDKFRAEFYRVAPTTAPAGSLREMLDTWELVELPRGKRPNSVATSVQALRRISRHAVASLPITDIEQADIEKVFHELAIWGNAKTGKGLRPRTIRHTAIQFGLAIRWGVDTGLIAESSSLLNVRGPSAKAARAPEQPHWSAAELDAFLAYVKAHKPTNEFAYFTLAGMSGLRRSEIAGLKWSDIDFDRGVLTVRRTWTNISGTGRDHGDQGKTENARRSISLDAETLATLKSWKAEQSARRLSIGDLWVDGNWIWTNGIGEIEPASAGTNRFRHAINQAIRDGVDVPRISLHGLRHTHVYILYGNPARDLDISKRMGHASPGFTAANYGHVRAGADADMAEWFADQRRSGSD